MTRFIALAGSFSLFSVMVGACTGDDPPTCQPPAVFDAGSGSCFTPPVTCADLDCGAQSRVCHQGDGDAVCGVCVSGTREVGGVCTPVTTCAQLDCEARQRACLEADGNNAAQCGACLPGFVDDGGTCARPSCEGAGTPGSLVAGCEAASRTCVQTATDASCGPCFSGFIDDGGTCRRVITCAELDCPSSQHVCEPAGEHTDAHCSACLPGLVSQVDTCVASPGAVCDPAPAEGSIAEACADAERNCLVGAPGARCGSCKDGFVEDADTGTCAPVATCAELDCAAQDRGCAETPNGHCTGCLAGFVEDETNGACRAVRTCAELTCGAGEECAGETAESDAFCRPDCGPRAIWGGSDCEPCPPCQDQGEVGVWPWPTKGGYCICETAPGYFYSLSADVGPFPCDADGDGWVRESARTSLESQDTALSANARCDLRAIDRFELRNHGGQSLTVDLSTPLELYETDRNDNDLILAAIWEAQGLPAYGARRARASELNRLTKICHDPRLDYNDNDVADVGEWSAHPLASSFDPSQQPFNEMSYFVELHRGWYEPGAGPYGVYVIEEKTRSAGAAAIAQVPLQYAAGDGAYWRECTVLRDADFDVEPQPVGMDFATYDDPSWAGMHHHSQFKCLVVDEEPDTAQPTEATPAEIAAYGYRLNRCTALGEPSLNAGNPAWTDVACARVEPTALSAGDVVWGAVPYVDHGPWVSLPYERGCVNECVDALPNCPYYDVNPTAIDCQYDPQNFGKFVTCEATEVCDGFDNTGEGSIDEGDPGGGAPCGTGQLGVCAAGTTHCRGGGIVCDANQTAGPEQCNGLDDNCNGSTDEGNPGGGVLSCTTTLLGACAAGRLHCQGGSLSRCDAVASPQDETGSRGCNGVDDNCNGTTDEPPATGQCPSPWTTYYTDADGDTYGASTDVGTCLCAPAGNKTATRGSDCCDADSSARPGGGYSTARNGCSSFDWNCDGIEEKRWTNSPEAGCGICAFCGCNASADGWKTSPPPSCGDTAVYYGGCDFWCSQETFSRTQQCK